MEGQAAPTDTGVKWGVGKHNGLDVKESHPVLVTSTEQLVIYSRVLLTCEKKTALV
jgi:hypothetical protein